MASVWCAEDRVLGRSVAVKVLAERFAHDEFAVRRFKREARTAARVSAHPHVVTIFDVGDIEPREDEVVEGQHPPARAFIVMEFLAGGTVADAIRVGAVERDQALLWLDQAASALDHAHQRGIVHRDIKPANFLLDNSRSLHVADFGIARLQSEDTITSTGQLFGTAAYLSPEQALGREATSASDRYALAVAAFELLAGERPFRATNFAAQARQHVEDRPPRASQCERALPAAVDPVLSRGMAKDPEARYETAGAFVEALKDSLDGPPTAMTRPFPALEAPQTREPRKTRRRAPAAGHSVSPIVPASGSSRRSGRMAALAALLVVVAGVALVAILGQVGGGNTTGKRVAGASSTAAKHKAAGHRAHTPRPAQSASTSASASSSTTTAASSSAAPTSAAGLQALGHQQLDDSNYSAAIPTLRQALHAADPSSLTYAYALYDLGRALMLSGDPKDAIPVLEQRLQIHNQTGVVQQTLDQARREAGVAAPAPTSSLSTPAPAPPTAPKHPKHHGPGPGAGNGGAGLPGLAHGNGNGDGGD